MPAEPSSAAKTTRRRTTGRKAMGGAEQRVQTALAPGFVGRLIMYALLCVLALFFALPTLWLVLTPFSANPSIRIRMPQWSLVNFKALADNPYALRALLNSAIIAGTVMVLVVGCGSLAAYALSRVAVRGRNVIIYALLLLSSIITGTAAMVPIFQLMYQVGLIDTRIGVALVLAGGLLPSGMFIVKDFMDSIPRSYEESAKVFGAKPWQILRDIVFPLARPGLATIAVWSFVSAWGDFLSSYILLRSPDKIPGGVALYTFYSEGGAPDLAVISTFALLYSIPVIALYLFVNRRYGFSFYGGIKS